MEHLLVVPPQSSTSPAGGKVDIWRRPDAARIHAAPVGFAPRPPRNRLALPTPRVMVLLHPGGVVRKDVGKKPGDTQPGSAARRPAHVRLDELDPSKALERNCLKTTSE